LAGEPTAGAESVGCDSPIGRAGISGAETEGQGMTDEPDNLILRLLQDIRADLASVKTDVAAIKGDVAGIKDVQRLHGMRLDTYSENFHDIIGLLRDMATAADLRDLQARVSALENRRQ
jgi:hypothetical protein